MQSSQDISQNLVAIKVTAPSPPEVPNEPVRLCDTCREAHHAALRDDGQHWEHIDGHIQLKHFPTPFQTLLQDEWPNLPHLRESARGGCGFCALLREAILSHKFSDAWGDFTEASIAKADWKHISLGLWYDRDLRPDLSFSHPRPRNVEYLTVRGTFEKQIRLFLHFELEAITDYPAVGKWLVLKPQTPRNRGDNETTSFLTRQLQQCAVSLENDDQKEVFLPERLIDVGTSRLRLVERERISANSAKRPQYCALSYCWGPYEDSKLQTKTTNENLARRLQSLDFDDLSQVLKDAVKATRSLSIPYLWVDSLCILQDDISDWQRQCAQMHEIYGKARVTLIAASSRTCREGFLNPRRLGLRLPYQSSVRPDISGAFMIYFTHTFGTEGFTFNPSLTTDLHNDLNFSQWARRGWTFQEDAMAGARIVYGASDVYFGMPNTKCWYVSMTRTAGFVQPKSARSLKSNDELHRVWQNVIRRYSAFTASSFTKQTDLLPALSGLARTFGQLLRVKYIAGHWADRLHISLLWWKDYYDMTPPSLDEITKRHGQKPYLIPSWSCLTRGRIEFVVPYDTRRSRSEITILDVYMPTVGSDPYGALRDACLTLEGFVLDLPSVSWSESTETGEWVGYVDSHAPLIWFEEVVSIPPQLWWTSLVTYDPMAVHFYDLKLDFPIERGNDSPSERRRAPFHQLISRVTLLLVASEESYEDDVPRGRKGYGLVLVPIDGASERSFLRVGTFYPNDRSRQKFTNQDSLPSFKRLMRKEKINIF